MENPTHQNFMCSSKYGNPGRKNEDGSNERKHSTADEGNEVVDVYNLNKCHRRNTLENHREDPKQ
jgi:hypothetical protein